MKLKTLAVLSVLSVLAGQLSAMPPREGIQEPEALKAMRLKGMDSPDRGLIQQLRSKDANAKITGSRSYPVVMGYFTDLAATNTQAEFQAMLFSNATGAKSVNNFYRDMSYNAMSCSGAVDNWRTSNNTVAYYGGGNYGLNNGTTANTYAFIVKTLAHADSFVNFAAPEYDQNQDGYVDVLWVVHTGKGAEETGSINDIWSHSANLDLSYTGGTYYTTSDISPYTGTAVRIAEYIINPERTNYADGNGGTTEQTGCGVFCHEFGHALGLPDLYDTGGYLISGNGIGNFSLMAGGSWGGNGVTNARPAALDVWCRRYLGWAAPTLITTDSLATVNNIMTTASSSSYKLAKLGADTTRQYWLVENRFKNAQGPVSLVPWDSLIPGQGLAIYHIDTTYTSGTYFSNNMVNNNSTTGSSRNRPYGVCLEETDDTTAGYISEMWYGTNNGEPVDVWNSGTQSSFGAAGTAYPVTYLNGTTPTAGGSYTFVAVRDIPVASAAMVCNLLVGISSDIKVSLLQNPAFSYSLGISMVSNYRLLTPNNLDTANLTIDSDPPERLNFSHPSANTFQANYTLQKTGNYAIRIASRDSDSVTVYRTGTRYFTVAAAKAAGGSIAALNGAVRLALPPGALARDEFWVISEHEAVNPNALVAGPAFQIGPTGRPLMVSTRLTLIYDPELLEGKDPAKLAVYELSNGQWRYCGGQVDDAGNSVTAEITNAGVYQLCWDASNPIIAPVAAARPHSANPSPFAQRTTISYQLGSSLPVSLKVYNISGQLVRTIFDGFQNAGSHTAVWDGRGDRNSKLPSGIYHYRLRIGNSAETGRMVKVQ